MLHYLERWEPTPGRASFVARVEGRDPGAPKLCLMGHTDVVPVHVDGWSREPFGGELVRNADGVDEVWGRGAVDMLNLTSSMAVAFKDMVAWVREKTGLSEMDAYQFVSQNARAPIVEMVDPQYTVLVKIEKSRLPR